MVTKEDFLEPRDDISGGLEDYFREIEGSGRDISFETFRESLPGSSLDVVPSPEYTASRLWDENGCLTQVALEALSREEEWLDEGMRLAVAEHLSFCDRCIERYTALLTDEILLAPLNDVALAVETELAAFEARDKLSQKQWGRGRYVSMVVAACAAMVIWISGGFAQLGQGFSFRAMDALSDTVKSAAQAAGSISEELTQKMWTWAVL